MKFKILVACLVLVVPTCSYSVHKLTTDKATFVVTDKERAVKRDSDGNVESKYLIFTDAETFENTDTIWGWKFNSSDVYGRIPIGQKCVAKVNGFRVSWLSWYRNILDINCENIP